MHTATIFIYYNKVYKLLRDSIHGIKRQYTGIADYFCVVQIVHYFKELLFGPKLPTLTDNVNFILNAILKLEMCAYLLISP